MSNALLCSVCNLMLPLSSYKEDDSRDNDATRICIMCKSDRDTTAKQIAETSQSETSQSEVTLSEIQQPMDVDSEQHQQQSQQGNADSSPVFIATQMYAHPEAGKWITVWENWSKSDL